MAKLEAIQAAVGEDFHLGPNDDVVQTRETVTKPSVFNITIIRRD